MKRLLIIATTLLLTLTGAAQVHGREQVRHIQSDGLAVGYTTVGTRTASNNAKMTSVLPSKGLNLHQWKRLQSNATSEDSILVILVDFADVHFRNGKEVYDSLFSQPDYGGTGSVSQYFYDQSGGRFTPGVRVVGPYTMLNNKEYYKGSIDQLAEMFTSAFTQADDDVDYVNFDNDDDGEVDLVFVCFAGDTIGFLSHNILYGGNSGTYDSTQITDLNLIDEFGGNLVRFDVDGMPPESIDKIDSLDFSPKPSIGTFCQDIGFRLGLPYAYGKRSTHWFDLMAQGYSNGHDSIPGCFGTLPSNLSVLEKSMLGWGAQFDTLQPGTDITLSTIGTANDHAYYLPIDGDEFFALEVRSSSNHWDTAIYGDVNAIGKGGLVIYHGKESRLDASDCVNCAVADTVGDEGWYVISAFGDTVCHFLMEDGEYIYQFEDPSVAFGNGYSMFSPAAEARPMKNDSTALDNIWIYNIRWINDSTMAFDYDTTMPSTPILDGRRFNTKATLNTLEASTRILTRQDAITAKGAVRSVAPSLCNIEAGTVFADPSAGSIIHMSIPVTDNDSSFYYRFYATANGHTGYSPLFHFSFAKPDVEDVYGISAEALPPTVEGTYNDENPNFYCFGDISFLFASDTHPITTVEYLTAVVEEAEFWDYVANSGLVKKYYYIYTEGPSGWGMYLDSTYDWYIGGDSITVFRNDWQTNRGLYELLQGHYSFTQHNQDRIPLPVVDADSDSMVVMMRKDRYGQVRLDAFHTVGCPTTFRSGYAKLYPYFPGAAGNDVLSDMSLQVQGYSDYYTYDPSLWGGKYTDHFYLLHGTEAEMTALGVSDSNTAAAYVEAHKASLTRHWTPRIPYVHWTGDSAVRPVNQSLTLSPWMADSTYYLYIIPYNYNGERGAVWSSGAINVYRQAVDIIPDGDTDSTWWRKVNGEIVWAWEYRNNLFPGAFYGGDHFITGRFLEGRFAAMQATTGMTPVQLLPQLLAKGQVTDRGYELPQATGPGFYYGDTAMNLMLDTTYELCVWFIRGDSGDTLFSHATLSTHGAPHFSGAEIERLQLSYYPSDGTLLYWLETNDATAYCHVLLGEVGALAEKGISSPATARQYCLDHSEDLPKFAHQYSETIFKSGNSHDVYAGDHYVYYNYVGNILSEDSTYAVYVVPYDVHGNQGFCRRISFTTPYSTNNCPPYTTQAATDITSHSAVLHGTFSSCAYEYNSSNIYMGIYNPSDYSESIPDPELELGEEEISALVSGLKPNTTYSFYIRSGGFSGGTLQFTTEACTVATSIDTTLCYNAEFHGKTYKYSTDVKFKLLAADGCDSIVTYHLNVLPQRIGYDTVVLCYGDEYDGKTYHSSTTITQTLQEEGMCDSTLKVRLNVLPRIKTTITDTLHGDSYQWDDEVLTAAGTYTHTYTAENGCDSTVTLRLVNEKPQEGIGDVSNNMLRITVEGRIIAVDRVEGCRVTIYDEMGRMLATRQDGIRFEAPATGTYFVQLNDTPARKVVVVQ